MQSTFSELEYSAKKRVTRRDRFLAELEALTPWAKLVAEIDAQQQPTEKKKQEAPLPLGDAAAKTDPFATHADVGMGSFKTLWIPVRYNGANKSQLFVDGRRFVGRVTRVQPLARILRAPTQRSVRACVS